MIHNFEYFIFLDKSNGCNVFCFIRFLKMSPTELFEITNGGLYYR